jgi:hypothetical protein
MANTHAKLPECAAVQATLVEQMERITENQRKISDKVFGNGRVGLDQQTDTNTRDIAEIIAAIKKMNEARELETKAREQDKRAQGRHAQMVADTSLWINHYHSSSCTDCRNRDSAYKIDGQFCMARYQI